MDEEDALVTGVKRKAAASAVGSVTAADPLGARKEPRADAASVRIAATGGDSFNEHYLRYFYAKLFPYKLMFRWLSYGNDPDSLSTSRSLKRDFFSRREWNFTMENDVFVRYLCFRDADELAKAIQQKQPHKIDVGAVFSAKPSLHGAVKDFKPLERELVFDIDMDAYDDIRSCCKGAKLCSRCWAFINVAVKVLGGALRDDFGFQHVLFVYSGRRGMHAWVCDEAARKLDNSARAAVAEYLSALNGQGGGGGGAGGDGDAESHRGGPSIARTLNGLTVPLHPSLARAYASLEPVFEASIIGEAGQGLLAREESWGRVLDAIPADLVVDGVNLRDTIRIGWEKSGATPSSRWAAFKSTVGGAIGRAAAKGSGVSRGTRAYLEKLVPSVVFTYTYPRLDIEVSKTMNHLLKAPFCIHPKTGRVCVPIDPEKVDAFDPTAVPTVAQLTEEATLYSRAAAAGGAGAAAGAGAGAMDEDGESSSGAGAGAAAIGDLWRHTRLEPYLKIFESFVQGCEAEVARKRKEDNDRTAAAFGDF